MANSVSSQNLLDALSLKVLCQGVDVTSYVSEGNVTWAMDEIARTMGLTFTVNEEGQFPKIPAHSNLKIFINKQLYFDGWVENLKIDPSRSGYNFQIDGRSKTCDFVDTTLGTSIEVKGKQSLATIISKISTALKPLKLKIITQADLKEVVTLDDEQFNGTPTTTLFDFLDKIARRFNLLVTSKADNTIVLTRVNQSSKPKYFMVVNPNNVESSHPLLNNVSLQVDTTQRYHTYRVHTKKDSPTRKKKISKSTIHGVVTSIDQEVRPTRVLDLELETATNDRTVLKERADWERNVRRGRSITYSGDVYGIQDPTTQSYYDVNELISVQDSLSFINSSLLIKKVLLRFSRTDGYTCNLDMAPIETFLPEPLPNRLPGVKGKKRKGRRRNRVDEDTLTWTTSVLSDG